MAERRRPDRSLSASGLALPRRSTLGFVVAATLGAMPASAQSSKPPELSLPVDCVIGRGCVVQNYVDIRPGPEAQDWTCGTRTYQDHNGDDFRLPSMVEQRRGVAVLAAAAGTVRRTRDGEPDVSVRDRGVEAVQGRECGNGLVIDHGGGWTTQYCHMAQGSLSVREGEAVKAGQPLGLVGLSGKTEYPHLHFTLRKGDKVMEPFALDVQPDACGLAANRAQAWSPEAAKALAYAERAILNTGFANGPVSNEDVESGAVLARRPSPLGEGLVFYVRAIGLKAGDVERIVMTGPNGQEIVRNEAAALTGSKAQVIYYAGRRRPGERFPEGRYTAMFEVLAGGQAVLTHTETLDLTP